MTAVAVHGIFCRRPVFLIDKVDALLDVFAVSRVVVLTNTSVKNCDLDRLCLFSFRSKDVIQVAELGEPPF